jgi:hypothetical protein
MQALLILALALPAAAEGEAPDPEEIAAERAALHKRPPLSEKLLAPLIKDNERFSFKDGALLDHRVEPPRKLSEPHARILLGAAKFEAALKKLLPPLDENHPIIKEMHKVLKAAQDNLAVFFPNAEDKQKAYDEYAGGIRQLTRDRRVGDVAPPLISDRFDDGERVPETTREPEVTDRRPSGLTEEQERDLERPRRDLASLPSRRDAVVPTPASTLSPATAGEVRALQQDIAKLDKQWRSVFKEATGRTPVGSWLGNACRGETCGLHAETFKGIIQQQKLAEKYPNLQFATIYQPGIVEDNALLNWIPGVAKAGNHQAIGVLAEGKLVGIIDSWGRPKGKLYQPFTGLSDMQLKRPWLGVMPWNGSAHYKVQDNGLPMS